MNRGGRYSIPWLVAAGVLFAADLFLHLPVTDFCDALVKRFGFFTFNTVVLRGFAAVGVFCLCGAWAAPQRRHNGVAGATAVLIAITALAQMLIVLNAVEDVHYPQYALMTCVLVRALPTTELAWIGSTALGAADEAYQFLELPRGTPTYYDWNDVVLNAIGATFGVLIMLMLSNAGRPRLLVSSRWMIASALVVLAAALVFAPPALVPFFTITPGGRRFHKMSAAEALAVAMLLWAGIRYLVTRRASDATPYAPTA